MKRITAILIALLFTSQLAHSQAGYLDKSFGSGGIVKSKVSTGEGETSDIKILPDGKILRVGNLNSDEKSGLYLSRHNYDGSLDTTFHNVKPLVLYTNPRILQCNITLYQDGRILVFGSAFYSDWTYSTPFIARFDKDGNLDPTFGVNGVYFHPYQDIPKVFIALKVLGDSSLLVAGYDEELDKTGYWHDNPSLFYITKDGMLDPRKGINGVMKLPILEDSCQVICAFIDDNDNCLFSSFNGNSYTLAKVHIVRYHPNGKYDNSFGDSGTVVYDLSDLGESVIQIQQISEGKLLCLVEMTSAPFYKHAVMRLLNDGNLDNTFAHWGTTDVFSIADTIFFRKFTVDSSNNFILSGTTYDKQTKSLFSRVVRFHSDGTLDSSFGIMGVAVKLFFQMYGIHSISVQRDGKYVIGGYSSSRSGEYCMMYRLNNENTSIVQNKIVSLPHLSLHPTPSTDNCTVTYTLPSSGVCTMTLRDESGREVRTFMTGQYKAAGKHEDELDLRGLAAGVYFLWIEHDGKIETAKVVVSH